jgi:hypothetical protein
MKTPGSAGFAAGAHRQLVSERQSRDSASETVVEAEGALGLAAARVSVAAGFSAASVFVERSGGVAAGACGVVPATGEGVGSLGAGVSARGGSGVTAGALESFDRDSRSANTITNAARMALPTTTQIA